MERGGLAKTNAILTEALEAVPDPVILIDPRRLVSFTNAAARQVWPMLQIGRPLFFTLRMPDLVDAVERVMGQGVAVDLEIYEKTPIERAFRVKILPLPTGYTAPERDQPVMMLMLHDLTAERRLEHMRVDFVANASHELRTPLSSLIGFIETLRGPARDDAKAREQFLEVMHQQAERMARLVRDLLALSTIEMSEHLPPSGEIALGNVLRNVADALQLQASARGVVIDLQLDKTLPTIIGDGEQLTQLFQNLIVNAIRYGAAESTVTVTAETTVLPGGTGAGAEIPAVRVSVADKGEGIPKEHLPRLTERFYRVDAARSRAVGGTGLGLAIVKHIVSRHRGLLRIESELGQGTIVSVSLPTRRETSRTP